MRLKEILSVDSIALQAEAADQIDAIEKMVNLQKNNGCVSDKGVYRSAVFSREDITSTALDGGIAIPHAKSVAVSKPCVAFMTLKKGVDWGAYDRSLSDLLFMIGAPIKGNEHLRLLTYITTMLTDVPALATQLREAKTAEEVLSLLEQAETACFGNEA